MLSIELLDWSEGTIVASPTFAVKKRWRRCDSASSFVDCWYVKCFKIHFCGQDNLKMFISVFYNNDGTINHKLLSKNYFNWCVDLHRAIKDSAALALSFRGW